MIVRKGHGATEARCLIVETFIRRTAIAGLLLGLPWTLLGNQDQGAAGSGDSVTSEFYPTASPSPAHLHKHTHLKQSPTASPTPGAGHEIRAAEEDSDDDVTPTPARRKHHHPAEADASDDMAAAVTPSPAADELNPANLASVTLTPRPSMAPNASLAPEQLQEFSQQPEKIQGLIEAALELTRQNLTYTYSSADPANGGLDCSGFVYYVLTQAGLKDVPRDASEQYSWVRKANNFRAVISRNLDGFELDELKPGDLLFWSGTYKTDRDPPVTHTMIYLGREKETGDRVMVGSSDGRSYHGLQRWGVSVFDFKPAPANPTPGREAARFIGYGAIPGY